MSIGQRLKFLRQDKNLTAKDFADLLNIPVRTIGGYERDENPPNEKFLTLLLQKLNVNINWLLSGSGNMYFDSDDLETLLSCRFNLSIEDAKGVLLLLKNEATREFILKFLKAKSGDINSIDALIQTLSGMKVAFS